METREQVRLSALALNDDDRAALAEELLASLRNGEYEPEELEQLLAARSAASKAGQVAYRDPLEIIESERKWDELLATPESQKRLEEMGRKAMEDYHAGRTEPLIPEEL